MKQVLLLISIVLLFFTVNTNAQLKPAQSQYLVEKGVLINPSFEQGYKGWVITGCTKSLVSETPYLNKSLKLTCTNETFSIKQVSTALTSFSKQQGAFDLQIKTTASGVNVSSITNGVRDNVYSVINSTEFKRFKEIGFIVGDTDNGIEVYSDTNFTGEIVLDNVKLGLGNLTQDIGAAHFVGSLTYPVQANCLWSVTSGTYTNFAADLDCSTTNIIGEVSNPSTEIPAVSIANARVDGYYKVVAQGFLFGGSGGVATSFRLSDGTNSGGYVPVQNAGEANSTISHQFKFSTSGTKTIQIQARSGGTAEIYASAADRILQFDVYFFPDSKNTIVSQDTELTAKTANTLAAYFNQTGSSAATLEMENYEWIDSCTRSSTGRYSCNTKIDLNVNPSCTGNTHDALRITNVVYDVTTTPDSFGFNIQNLNNVAGDASFNLTCEKLGTDVNKSQTIVGSFEQIRSDDLLKVVAIGGLAEAITASTNLAFTEISDVGNVWNGRELEIPINKGSGTYTFDGSLRVLTGQQGKSISVFVDEGEGSGYVARKTIAYFNSTNNVIYKFTANIQLNGGDKAVLRFSDSNNVLDLDVQTYLTITELPTKESIVANLMQGQTTKCQTKILSAPTASTGIIADLTMSNMTIGKKYEATFHLYEENNALTNIEHNGSILARTYIVGGTHIYTINTGVFTATAETLTINKTNTPITQGNGTKDSTWLQLCELPETVIETTEFN